MPFFQVLMLYKEKSGSRNQQGTDDLDCGYPYKNLLSLDSLISAKEELFATFELRFTSFHPKPTDNWIACDIIAYGDTA